MSANEKYNLRYCENLQLPIEMQLSEKEKCFSKFFVSFVEFTSIFKHYK